MVAVLCRILAERRELEKSELVYGEPSIGARTMIRLCNFKPRNFNGVNSLGMGLPSSSIPSAVPAGGIWAGV
jgi:hypothetical protein